MTDPATRGGLDVCAGAIPTFRALVEARGSSVAILVPEPPSRAFAAQTGSNVMKVGTEKRCISPGVAVTVRRGCDVAVGGPTTGRPRMTSPRERNETRRPIASYQRRATRASQTTPVNQAAAIIHPASTSDVQ